MENVKIEFYSRNVRYKNRILTCLVLTSQITSLIFVSKWNNINIVGGDVDGALFMKSAENILNGNWLGDYNKFTLVKSPGYSIWLAFANRLGIQYVVVFHFLFIISVYLYAFAFQTNIKNKHVTITILVALPWFPYEYVLETYRDLFLSLTYFNCVSIILILYKFESIKRKYRVKISFTLIAFLFMNVGILVITREDYFIVFVAPVVLFFFGLFQKEYKSKRINKQSKMLMLIILINFASVNVAQLSVKQLNENFYGVSLINDWRYGAFPELIKQLKKYNVNEQDFRFVISRGQRKELGTHSENFLKYTADLENNAQGWNAQSCIYLNVCNDVTKSWFPWALRDSLVSLNVFSSASNFQKEMKDLTIELELICNSDLSLCDKGNSFYREIQYYVPTILSDLKFISYYLSAKKWHSSDSWKLHYERTHQISAREVDYQIARKVVNGLPDNPRLYVESRKTHLEFPFYIYTKILDNILFTTLVLVVTMGIIMGKFMFSKEEYEFFSIYFLVIIFQSLLIVINNNLNYGLSLEISGSSYAVGLKIITQIQLITLVMLMANKIFSYSQHIIKNQKWRILAKSNLEK
jgi:hypothetical protein